MCYYCATRVRLIYSRSIFSNWSTRGRRRLFTYFTWFFRWRTLSAKCAASLRMRFNSVWFFCNVWLIKVRTFSTCSKLCWTDCKTKGFSYGIFPVCFVWLELLWKAVSLGSQSLYLIESNFYIISPLNSWIAATSLDWSPLDLSRRGKLGAAIE